MGGANGYSALHCICQVSSPDTGGQAWLRVPTRSFQQLHGSVARQSVVSRRGVCNTSQKISCSHVQWGVAPVVTQKRRSFCLRAQQSEDASPSNSTSATENSTHDKGAAQVEGLAQRAPYGLITLLAATGVVETSYLTWSKLFGEHVSCPLGGNCNNVLDSDYAVLFGLPLSLYGLVAYAAVGILSQVARVDQWGHSYMRWLLLGSTSLMATASAYLMYILVDKFPGDTCSYCFVSATLSATLFVSTLRGFRWEELKRAAGAQLALSTATLAALLVAFGDVESALGGAGEIDLPPIEPEVTTTSGINELKLARHLKAVGAKMYGAFWCSHCYEQKQMFGKEAAKLLDYVECYPSGYRRGVVIADACDQAGIDGFPTWIINGEALPGEQSLDDLATTSSFDVKNAK